MVTRIISKISWLHFEVLHGKAIHTFSIMPANDPKWTFTKYV